MDSTGVGVRYVAIPKEGSQQFSSPLNPAASTGRESAERELQSDLAYLFRLARALTGGGPDLDDLIHSTYLKAARHLTPDMQSRQGYLRRAMISILNDQNRRVRIIREIPVAQTSDVAANTDSFAAVDNRIDLKSALNQLDPLTRQILILRYLEDMSTAGIAKVINRPEGTIRRICAQRLLVAQ